MKISRTFVYFSLLLIVLYVIQWWLLFYYLTDVPDYIPGTNIKVSGFVLAITVLPVLYFFLKTLYKRHPSSSVLQLTVQGILLAFVAEIVFQIIRQSVSGSALGQKLTEGARAVVVATFGIGLFSFMMAFRLKKKSLVWNTVILLAFFVLVYLLKTYASLLP